MRNKRLKDLLYTLAYDACHHAGEDEVKHKFESLCHDFAHIDAMLPRTCEPKFKVGDKVECLHVNGRIRTGLYGEVINKKDVYTYVVRFNEFELILEEDELVLLDAKNEKH